MQSGPMVAIVGVVAGGWGELNMVKTGQVMARDPNPAYSKPGPSLGTFAFKLAGTLSMAEIPWSAEEIGLWFSLRNWWIT